MNSNLVIGHAQAFQVCQDAHNSINQKRKYSGQPYWEHPHQVANILMNAGVTNPDMIAAAYCHDILEDVYPTNPMYSPDFIRKIFGDNVLYITLELTDEYTREKYPAFNRDKRHTLEAKRLGGISVEAVTIKLADLIANTSDIVAADPGFATRYLPEKQRVLAEFAPIVKQYSGNKALRSLYQTAVEQASYPMDKLQAAAKAMRDARKKQNEQTN